MQKSEQINELAKALCKAQAEMTPAVKDSDNPYFKSKYADYLSVWKACTKALVNNDLSVSQLVDSAPDGSPTLVTLLLHTSGQWLMGTQPIIVMKKDPQGVGSSITYARRYGLAALLALPQEDDDGEASMIRPAQKQPIKHPQIPATEFPSNPADFIMPCGKNKGKKIKDTHPEDIQGAVNFAIKTKFSTPDMQNHYNAFVKAANAYLQTMDPLNEELPY